ncbi:hypothetical protein R2103_00825 [Nitrosomonas sp. Is24]|uniref:hypothetical protein n=1 Tax=Nitrosomonas sp. Is24 TaxID=3080533 RepID=UPI00294B480B|nr:hypothetical protein [Nitrosomonas sp. Is24]MDV6340315.1 hypothetical protein [Nitrosomonas sp. Is24]
MNKKQVIFGAIAVLAISAFCLWSIYSTLQWFQALNASVAAALITASLGLIGLWYAQWQSKTRDIAESHRASKIEIYNLFFDLVDKFQKNNITDLSEENISESLKFDFQKLNRGLLLWASPGVITAYLKFRTVSTSGENILQAVDNMYREIRKDLGHSNFQLKAGDLIRIGLKDPNELK